MIRIIDCGSQVTQNIARRIRELGVYADIKAYNHEPRVELFQGTSIDDVIDGYVISGGHHSVYDDGAPSVPSELFNQEKPVLGICYGLQTMSHQLGGKVTPAAKREYGTTSIAVNQQCPLFAELPRTFNVYMSHGDIVENVPTGFSVVARSANGHVAAIQHEQHHLYAVQFHPEVDHTEHGREMLERFVNLTNAKKKWDSTRQYESVKEYLLAATNDKVGVGGVSGGVDSTTASILLGRLVGDSFHPIFVDNGVLRKNEGVDVASLLNEHLGTRYHYIDASDLFLERLAGISDPDKKRDIIGRAFVDVFQAEAKKIPNASYLLQGTLYPDVIESVPVYGATSKIKRHHNVGGLGDKLHLKLVEPFRHLFKDEVRRLASEHLGLPDELVWRHPFPGPGLGVRIIGEVTPEKLSILREADDLFITELRERGLYDEISQALAVLTGTNTVGVMGDAGTYEHVIALRAVVTKDFMTATPYEFSWPDLRAITNRIVNEVRGVNRVVYDTTQKPPSTIEWE